MTTNTSLIDPGEVDSKSPLKKSTIAWAVGLLVGLALLGIYGPKWISTAPAQAEAPKSSAQPTGSAAQIDAEAASAGAQAARDRAAREADARRAPDTSQAPSSAASDSGRPTAAAVRPSNNAVTLPQADPSAAAEIEAAARTSRSLVVDASPALDAFKKGATGASAGAASQTESVPDAVALQTALGAATGQQRNAGADRLNALLAAQGAAGVARDPNRDWVKDYAGLKPSAAIQPTLPGSPYTLIQGKVIPAVLGKSLNSDLPGDITAFTTTDIYDSISGQSLLIPKGSQLVGEYANAPRPGQVRLMFAFSRIVLPNGMSFALPGNKGQDGSGMSGLEGDVNNHYFKRFASAFFVAVLAQKYDNQQVSGTVIQPAGPQTAVGQVLTEIAKSDLNRNRDIPPTITIPSGTRINVQVAADMEFPHAYPSIR